MPTAAFDMLGTFFSLESLRPRLLALGAPRHALELWFASSVRDLFATSHAGGYEPLTDLLTAALPRTLAELGVDVPDEKRLAQVLEGLNTLAPAEGAVQAVELLTRAGWKLLALTNGGEANTNDLLARLGLLGRFASVLSTDSVRVNMPHPEVFARAREEADGELWLVSAHAWGLQGARKAGLLTAWVASQEKRWLDVWPGPDIQADNLAELARVLLATARTGVEPSAPPFMPLG